jgi:hypothetical protein
MVGAQYGRSLRNCRKIMIENTENTENTTGDVIDLDAHRRKALVSVGSRMERMIRAAREHPIALYKLIFVDDLGFPITVKPFHKEWADMMLKRPKVMIESPRGSTKTTWVINMILWMLGHNQNLRIKLICGDDDAAIKRLSEIVSHITGNRMYREVFPNVGLDRERTNDKHKLNLNRSRHGKDATVEAKGILSSGTGDRADLIVLDDICTRKNTLEEPALRPKVLQALRSDWLNTLNPRDGRVWSIFTPWHIEDANAILKKEVRNNWAYKRYCHGKPNDPYFSIFPELFTRETLIEKRVDLGAREYACAYLCRAMSGEGQVVQSTWLNIYTPRDLTQTSIKQAVCIISVDPAGDARRTMMRASKTEPDYYGLTIFLVFPQGEDNPYRPTSPNRVYVTDAYQVRFPTAHAVQHILELQAKWDAEAIILETQSAQSIHSWLWERDPTLNLQLVSVSLNKRIRLEGITPWLQDYRQRVLFHPRAVTTAQGPFPLVVDGPEPAVYEAQRTLRTQLLDFPTAHDDVMDSLVQGLTFIRGNVVPYEINNPQEAHSRQVNMRVEYLEA